MNVTIYTNTGAVFPSTLELDPQWPISRVLVANAIDQALFELNLTDKYAVVVTETGWVFFCSRLAYTNAWIITSRIHEHERQEKKEAYEQIIRTNRLEVRDDAELRAILKAA